MPALQAVAADELRALSFPAPDDAQDVYTLSTHQGTGLVDQGSGALLAWDPVKQKAAWKVPYPTHWNGGTLSTAGNLVFEGSADGRVIAYAADDGVPKVDAQDTLSGLTLHATGLDGETVLAGLDRAAASGSLCGSGRDTKEKKPRDHAQYAACPHVWEYRAGRHGCAFCSQMRV